MANVRNIVRGIMAGRERMGTPSSYANREGECKKNVVVVEGQLAGRESDGSGSRRLGVRTTVVW
jgi:hypothetical protein